MATNEINPSHYGAGSKHECIDVMMQQFGRAEVLSFCKLNAFKYIYRMGRKGNPMTDARKAAWYLDRFCKFFADEGEDRKMLSDIVASVNDGRKEGEA